MTTTCCANCGAKIHNPRHTIVKKGRRLTLCLNCLLERIPASRRAVVTAPPAPVVISDISLADSVNDGGYDDFDDAAGFAMSLGDA